MLPLVCAGVSAIPQRVGPQRRTSPGGVLEQLSVDGVLGYLDIADDRAADEAVLYRHLRTSIAVSSSHARGLDEERC